MNAPRSGLVVRVRRKPHLPMEGDACGWRLRLIRPGKFVRTIAPALRERGEADLDADDGLYLNPAPLFAGNGNG